MSVVGCRPLLLLRRRRATRASRGSDLRAGRPGPHFPGSPSGRGPNSPPRFPRSLRSRPPGYGESGCGLRPRRFYRLRAAPPIAASAPWAHASLRGYAGAFLCATAAGSASAGVGGAGLGCEAALSGWEIGWTSRSAQGCGGSRSPPGRRGGRGCGQQILPGRLRWLRLLGRFCRPLGRPAVNRPVILAAGSFLLPPPLIAERSFAPSRTHSPAASHPTPFSAPPTPSDALVCPPPTRPRAPKAPPRALFKSRRRRCRRPPWGERFDTFRLAARPTEEHMRTKAADGLRPQRKSGRKRPGKHPAAAPTICEGARTSPVPRTPRATSFHCPVSRLSPKNVAVNG